MTKEAFLAAFAAGDRDFRGADLQHAGLQHANLRAADLTGANLRDVTLIGANLRAADLTGADLQFADLSDADLTNANLSGANLRDADLIDADLTGANLSGADLRGANLRDADLSDADLTGADLSGADLRVAKLQGAIGFRFPGSPDPLELRKRVADQIRNHPELHEQKTWGGRGDDAACGTPCCVAGWACRLGGGARGHLVSTAATRLLHCEGYRLPSFDADASREDILWDLLVPLTEQND